MRDNTSRRHWSQLSGPRLEGNNSLIIPRFLIRAVISNRNCSKNKWQDFFPPKKILIKWKRRDCLTLSEQSGFARVRTRTSSKFKVIFNNFYFHHRIQTSMNTQYLHVAGLAPRSSTLERERGEWSLEHPTRLIVIGRRNWSNKNMYNLAREMHCSVRVWLLCVLTLRTLTSDHRSTIAGALCPSSKNVSAKKTERRMCNKKTK